MPARRAPARAAWLVIVAATGMLALAACAPETGSQTPASTSPSAAGSETPRASGTPSPSATGTGVSMPSDCRAILSETVLSQLGSTPLNPEGFGPVGVQPDGSLVCLWRDPAADTTFLSTEISRMDRGPALDLLNGLAAEGFTCYTPEQGTRCEKTWQNETYPVTDGRTLFWRDDILIDTTFSNLAPTGYTDAIVSSLFPS